MGQGRRCARPGCRAWAMRGRDYCRAHHSASAPEAEPTTPERPLTLRDLIARPDFRPLLEQRIASVLAQSDQADSLAEEIGALRLVLARLLAEEDDPILLAANIPRIVNGLVRAVRAQRTLSGAMAESLTEAITQALIEFGLGGE